MYSFAEHSAHIDAADSRSYLACSYMLNEGLSISVVQRSAAVSLRWSVA